MLALFMHKIDASSVVARSPMQQGEHLLTERNRSRPMPNTFHVCTWPYQPILDDLWYQHSFTMTQLGTNISVTDI